MRVRICLAVVALIAAAPLGAQQAPSASGVDNEGYAAGQAVGATKSVIRAHALAGSTSLMLPGAGLVYLLFLKTGEVKPNFAEQASLQGKTPAYIQGWTQGYDDVLTKRQEKAILISTAVGSVIAYFVIYKPLLNTGY